MAYSLENRITHINLASHGGGNQGRAVLLELLDAVMNAVGKVIKLQRSFVKISYNSCLFVRRRKGKAVDAKLFTRQVRNRVRIAVSQEYARGSHMAKNVEGKPNAFNA